MTFSWSGWGQNERRLVAGILKFWVSIFFLAHYGVVFPKSRQAGLNLLAEKILNARELSDEADFKSQFSTEIAPLRLHNVIGGEKLNEQTIISRLNGSWELDVMDSVEVSLAEGYVPPLPGLSPRQTLLTRFDRVAKTSSFEIQGSEFVFKYESKVISRVPFSIVKSDGSLHILELDLKGEPFKNNNILECEIINSNELRLKWLRTKEKKNNPSEIWKQVQKCTMGERP